MRQITKNDLIKQLDEALDLHKGYLALDSDKYVEFTKFNEVVRALLIFLPDDADLSSLNCFDFSPYATFADFVKLSDTKTVSRKFDEIKNKLFVFVKTRTENQTKVYNAKEDASGKYSKSGNIVFYATIGSIIVATIIVVVLALIEQFGGVAIAKDKGDDFFSSLAGIIDATIGVLGFGIERILDHKSRNMAQEANDTIKNHANNTEYCNTVVENSIKSFFNRGKIQIGNNYHGDDLDALKKRDDESNSPSPYVKNNTIKSFFNGKNGEIQNGDNVLPKVESQQNSVERDDNETFSEKAKRIHDNVWTDKEV